MLKQFNRIEKVLSTACLSAGKVWPAWLKAAGIRAVSAVLPALLLAGSARDVSAFSPGGYFNQHLPVKITTFTAKYNPARKVVSLHWVTTMEKNNEHFVIERSLDSLHFVVIGKARSVGNSHAAQHYYFDDPKPVGGRMFYRLREIDSSGKQFLTTVISAYEPVTQLEVTGIRPSKNGQRLSFAVISPKVSSANIVVADISGHVVRSYLLRMKVGANLQSIYIGNLKPGIYFLQVNDKEGNGSVMGRFTHKISPKKP